ncbi:amino acid ABC transporter permease, partial [Enterococcus faecium]|nr:amino acid ABC transporter permease [Enterococcus faecium]
AATITVPEIFQKAKIIGGRTFDYFSLYILVALIYWVICIGIEKVQQYLEKRSMHQSI